MSTTDIIQALKRNRHVDKITAALQEHLAAEQKAREAFWAEAHEDTLAEWIAGRAVLHSPVKGKHFIVSSNLTFAFQSFIRQGFGGILAYETTLVACGRHDFMPDIAYWREARRPELGLESSIFPAPDFVVEILSKSTEKTDRGLKMEAYAEAGVQEYWLVDIKNLAIETYYPGPGSLFIQHTVYQGGRIPCRALSGFELPVRDVFVGVEG